MTEKSPHLFETLTEIKAAALAEGSHWFDKGSMRFFHTQISPPTLFHRAGRCFFISSECMTPGETPRKWNVREALADGSILTLGEFMAHESRVEAVQFLKDTVPK